MYPSIIPRGCSEYVWASWASSGKRLSTPIKTPTNSPYDPRWRKSAWRTRFLPLSEDHMSQKHPLNLVHVCQRRHVGFYAKSGTPPEGDPKWTPKGSQNGPPRGPEMDPPRTLEMDHWAIEASKVFSTQVGHSNSKTLWKDYRNQSEKTKCFLAETKNEERKI